MEKEQIGDWMLYKNNQLIAFNKPAGIPTQEDKTGDKSLLSLGEIYSKSKLNLLHRIDRPASGVVVFAKTSRAVQVLSEQFQNRTVKKTYLAVVKNAPPEASGELVHYLKKLSKMNKSVISEESDETAKKAEMSYKVLASSDNYRVLEIELKTGRYHQIRAQLGAIGCPIKGDVKYGARRNNRDRSIHLHAWKIKFVHPTSQEEVEIVAPLPKENLWQAFDLEK